MRYRTFDIYFLIFFIALGVYGGIQLFANSPGYLAGGQESSIATLISTTNTVKHKRHGLWAWVDSMVGGPLGVGDQVYTYRESTAQLKFEKGQQIELAQNTLFKITPESSNGARVSVEKGIATALLEKGAGNLEILVDGKVYKIESEGAKLQIIGNKRINLLGGEVAIHDQSNKRVKLSQNQFWEYDGGKGVVGSYKIELLSPAEASKLLYRNRSRIEFFWKQKQRKKLFLVVASDESFKNIVFRQAVSGKSSSVLGLTEGEYYWRVEDKNGKLLSRISTFSLREDRPIEVYYPEDRQMIFAAETYDNEILIEWDGRSFAGFELEVEDSKKQRERFIVDASPSFIYKLPKLGLYRFRVRPIYGEKKLLWSKWSHFGVKVMERPDPPSVIFPRDQFEINLFEENRLTVELRWMPVRGVSHYEIEVSSGEKVTVEGSTFTWMVPEAGKYWWRVRSLDYRQRSTSFGEKQFYRVNFIQYNSLAPQDGTHIKLKKPNQRVDFEWEKVGRSRYLFQLSETVNFERIKLQKEVVSTHLEMNFPDLGTYYWRIKILDGKGHISYSRPIKVMVSPTPPPDKPEEIIEDREIELELESSVQTFDFLIFRNAYAKKPLKVANIDWKKDENASKYEVEIYADSKMTKLFFKKTVGKNKLRIDNMEPGVYYWRIAVIDHWKRKSPFSDLHKLLVSVPKRFKDFREPFFKKYKLGDESFYFTWGKKIQGARYEIEFSRFANFKRVLKRKKLRRIKGQIKLQGTGKFYVRIVAKGEFIGTVRGERISFVRDHPKKIPTVVRKKMPAVKKKVYPKKDNFLNFFYVPEKVLFEQVSANHDVDINGFAINSVAISGRYQAWRPYVFSGEIKHVAGKVFNDNTLVNTDSSFLIERDFFHFPGIIIGAGVGAYLNISRYYQYIDEDNVSDQAIIGVGPLVSILGEYLFKNKNSIESSLQLGFLGQTLIKFKAYYNYKYAKNFELQGGVSYNYRFISSQKLTSHAFGLLLGARMIY